VRSLGCCMELASHIRQHMDCEVGLASKAILLGEMLGVACAEHRALYESHTVRADNQAWLEAQFAARYDWATAQRRLEAHIEGIGLMPYARAGGPGGAPPQQALFKLGCAARAVHAHGSDPYAACHAGGGAPPPHASAPDAAGFDPHSGLWLAPSCGDAFVAQPQGGDALMAAPHPHYGDAFLADPPPECGGDAFLADPTPECGDATPAQVHCGDRAAGWLPAVAPDACHAQAYRQAVGGDAALWLDAAGRDPVCPRQCARAGLGAIGTACAASDDLRWARPPAAAAYHLERGQQVLPPQGVAAADPWGCQPVCDPAAAARAAGATSARLPGWTSRRRRRELGEPVEGQRMLKVARG
jgi:hypothetical protein